MHRKTQRDEGLRRLDALTKFAVAAAVVGTGGFAAYFAHDYKAHHSSTTTPTTSGSGFIQTPANASGTSGTSGVAGTSGSAQVTTPTTQQQQVQQQYQPPIRSGGS